MVHSSPRSSAPDEAPAALSSLTVLTPGDFSVVRRKAEVTGQLSDAEALVAMLKAECDVKPNQPGGMGFLGLVKSEQGRNSTP